MADPLTRLQIVEIARSLILKAGPHFTMASLCIELSCTRSALRRHFPNKAGLITAVFDGSPAEIAPKSESLAGGAKPQTAGTDTAEWEWVDCRFRIFERAIATLESDIQAVRQDSSKSLARLEKKISTSAKASDKRKSKSSFSTGKHDNADEPYIEVERNDFDETSGPGLDETERPSGNFSSDAPTYRITPLASEPPPFIDSGETVTASRGLKLDGGLKRDLNFTTAPQQSGWKDISIFGLTAFVAALFLLGLVVVFTAHAGASYLPGDKALGRRGHAIKATSSQKAEAFGNISPGNRVIVNASAPIVPISLASSLTAKALSLEQFLPVESIALNQAGIGDQKAKLKLALAFARGDGVKADPMMAVFWSEAAAQQGNADAQYVLGTLYSEGIKPDPAQAFRWFSSAAVGGNRKAMHNLAIALLNGVGVAKDQASAAHWFVRAANLGYRDSAFDLGVLYERGQGVAQNSRTALSWYDNAAALGDQQAAQRAALLRSDGLAVSKSD
jgi:TPR repeat protein